MFMFIVREYAACLLVLVMFTAALLVAACGIFLAFKTGGLIAARTPHSLRAVPIRQAHLARIAFLVTVFFLIFLLKVARANGPSASQSAQDNGYTIKVSVDQVVVHATVRNSSGTTVSGLAKANYQVYEDGVLQEI